MYDIINPENIRVALLAGGNSSEREISLASGDGAQKALEDANFNVERLDPARKEDLKRLIDGGFDVAFLCLHGRGGEDGALQGFLETVGLPYTGSGVLASAACMDKTVAKLFYKDAGIPTPQCAVIKRADGFDIKEVLQKVSGCNENGCKCVIKAASEGSSVGVYIEEGATAIENAINNAFEYDDTVLVERYINGTELTVVVLGDKDLKALPIIEIVPKNESYDFEAKYALGGSEHICPARIDEDITKTIQRFAMCAHKVLGCSGVSRTDFILDKNGQPWALETNTLPGMTQTSLLPDAAKTVGISFPELCTGFIRDALNRA
ncbi:MULTISPECIES: D-alanine--D-alanine ligase [unclassified Adlercreutzia]|uniref:D-alanine--D-alanine ligase n=1 Tax=unclassified Adlercreutzia TaxID=2636013 RepID=UPI0013EAC3F3|nr:MULTISPECIES: D-alanine--D-alanine ligase [unclassified Adlercreutzia]